MLAQGIIPLQHEMDKLEKENEGGIPEDIEDQATLRYDFTILPGVFPFFLFYCISVLEIPFVFQTKANDDDDEFLHRPMGVVSALVNTPNQTAAEIVKEMMDQAVRVLGGASSLLKPSSKL